MIFVLDKPSGMTSQRAVSRVRRLLQNREKAGHTGTLDPMCTGVLPILTGADTRLADLFEKKKEYRATALLGVRTDTGDVTGTTIQTSAVSCEEPQIREALRSLCGTQMQVPPMYSAVRVNGQHLYELARQGIVTERAAREITVYETEFLGREGNLVHFRVACSAGTYIRTLCEDLGKKLGTEGTMEALRRTLSNGFSLGAAHTLEELEQAAAEGTLQNLSLSAEDAFGSCPCVTVPKNGRVYFCNGGEIALSRLTGHAVPGRLLRAYAENGCFLGLAQIKENGLKAVWIQRDATV